ncbi:MAG TPA: hypothetical protein VHM69_03930 [Rubrobacter sp.]|nr:hypothetical protein [Rubrobacter sp.]
MPGGIPLIGKLLDGCAQARQGRWTLLILVTLVAAVFAGCGGAGGVGSAQSSGQEGQRASQEAGPSEEKSVAASGEDRATSERLGHPSFGSADAPVVLIEFGDYQ